MISVDEAKKIIKEEVNALNPVLQNLSQSAGLVLAADVFATMDIPAFNQSSMDGYAFSFGGWQANSGLKIAGEIPAGSNENILYSPEKAVRIFTGAAVPEGTDTVVMQEKVIVENGMLIIEDENLKQGGNVRLKGSEIKTGELALASGSMLSSAAIGFLAGIGITKVQVYPKPMVSIIVTGKELQQPGQPLQHGQVYESNSATLTAALQQLHIGPVKIFWADDDLAILKQVLQDALNESDVVLLTGGVSVGDYDFVLEAANLCEITQLFHKIKQRPGKPLYFGKKEQQLVFGLPGNPSSVLTCFYEYVIPALHQLRNVATGLKTLQVPLAKAIEKPAGLTHFLKGFYDGEKAMPLNAQESYRLSSFARANCLIKIDEDIICCSKGENVEIHLFG
jgi:molybdopterin molybdotransferase